MIRTLAFAVLSAAFAGSALAQDVPQPRGQWGFLLGAATDNRSKGVSKSDQAPYAYGVAEWSDNADFLYVDSGFETIDSSTGASLELGAGVGVRPQVMGFDLDLNLTRKWMVDADPGQDHSAWEITADVSRSIGPAEGLVRVQHSPNGTGSTEAWTWYEARLSWDFNDRLAASGSIGQRDQELSVDYSAWDLGVTYALTRAIQADLRWYDTDADTEGRQYEDALVLDLSIAF